MNKLRKIESYDMYDLVSLIRKYGTKLNSEYRKAIIRRTCMLEKNSEKVQIIDQFHYYSRSLNTFEERDIFESFKYFGNFSEDNYILDYLLKFAENFCPDIIDVDCLLSKFSVDDLNKYTLNIINNYDTTIYQLINFLYIVQKYLSLETLKCATKIICKKGHDGSIILCVTMLKVLDSTLISLLAKRLIEVTSNISKIYNFLEEAHNVSKEDKKMLINKILDSRDNYYICLVAVFIDNSLIEKIFGSKDKMYQFIITLNKAGAFSPSMLEKVTDKLYNKPGELSESITIFNNNIDKYTGVKKLQNVNYDLKNKKRDKISVYDNILPII